MTADEAAPVPYQAAQVAAEGIWASVEHGQDADTDALAAAALSAVLADPDARASLLAALGHTDCVPRALLAAAVDALEDACLQGTGAASLDEPGWHMFMSTYEHADELLPSLRDALDGGDSR